MKGTVAMESLNIARWGGLISMISGALWILHGLITLLLLLLHLDNSASKSIYDYLTIILYSCALLTLIGAPLGIHALQAQRTRGPGALDFFVIILGALLAAIGNLLGNAFGISFMQQFVYIPAFIALLIGMLIFAVLILTAGLFPPRYSVMLVVGLLALFLVAAGGGLVLGILWIILGYSLWSGKAMMATMSEGIDQREF